jgi:hypothetical protein
MLPEVVSGNLYMRLGKKTQRNFQADSIKQIYKWRKDDNIGALLRIRNCKNGVDRTGSKLRQVGVFVISDF